VSSGSPRRALRTTTTLAVTLLLIEFLDEFVYGAGEAAWPLIRTDLGLSYAQIGILLSVPGFLGSFIEPAMGILADVWKRRVLVLGGGIVFALALLLTAASQHFLLLLVAFILFSPASGVFVGLAQATLMDGDPDRHEQNMARWTFAGSAGVVAGPVALGLAAGQGLGWRGLYVAFCVLALVLLGMAWRIPYPRGRPDSRLSGFKEGVVDALRALRRGEVLRWLTLLEFADLVMDVLLGFLALYFVDVVGVTAVEAGVAVAIWTGAGLVGNLLLIPLLERIAGLRYLRLSAVLELALFVAFLLVPSPWAKFALLAPLGLFSTGWYSVLKAQLYRAMPGMSGTVLTVGNVFGLAASLLPLGLGLVAERFDLRATMWLLSLGPIALLIGVPGSRGGSAGSRRGDA
jgi:FSR family fosmidomycin resistance protein-like MFS transporter